MCLFITIYVKGVTVRHDQAQESSQKLQRLWSYRKFGFMSAADDD
ncbi:hypothetical protein [Nodularia spumigena]|jgi:hypothetical protein|uniref:Uncharacterized protein n=1 Tax=Nodularia spumigena UHCC 0060 TaxID=3110300 RepID=A0ABU5UT05_NODSP|nr:hypothetical protein [Nodularia spumigena]AHJ27220.1 hypothetical protein NSP_8750 [Nodularia spumigena CCY9414]MEA5526816.1 hypothetical protein [Nodularia spumigena UHCC 0143]MEA5609381.1 hypothetical protein [Nodularia spumigena UHCC 0060]